MSKLLEIKNLCGGYEPGVNILHGVDLTVDEGEAVGIIGLNGSGKSTLGKAVMNLIPYRKGSLIFDGQHVDVIPLLQKPKKELMRTMADKLSGGQRHELALAMTLIRKPKLVILDEPSAGLSPKAVEEMYGMLGKIRERYGVSTLLIEQNVQCAVEFCHKCMLLSMGVAFREFVEENLTVKRVEMIMFNNSLML